jgi:amino acid transporter
MTDASMGVPRAMIGSVIINGLMGFGFIIAVLFNMGDLDTVLSTPYGFPIIQIFLNVTSGNVRAATAMASAIVLMASLATIPLILSAARTLWALARDQAFPFASALSQLDERKGIPTRAVCATTGFLAIIGLLNIASTSAFNAILSLSVVGLYASYLMAVLAILYARITRPAEIKYGSFRLGKFGTGLNILSILYTVFTMVFMLFPPYLPVTAVNMNYACVILSGVLVFSSIYWMMSGRKVYFGPVDVSDIIDGRAVGNTMEA